MAAPAFDVNAPDPSATSLVADLGKTRDNAIYLAIAAAANGGRLPDWDSAYTYTNGNVTSMTLTNQTDTLVKIQVLYYYGSGNLTSEEYYFDKGLGNGYELLNNGVLTYTYTNGDLTSIAAGNTPT